MCFGNGEIAVAPIKPTTIPRLELTAATVAVKQHRQISQELDLKVDSVKFWTDSTCVLQYINNESNRFKTFVANRIAIIHELSSPSCWRYVDSEANPADHASRGLRPTDTRGVEQWINGPDFLRCDEGEWPVRPKEIKVLPDDALEWKKDVSVYETRLQQVDPLDSLVQHYSSWYRLLKALAWLVRFSNHLQASHQASHQATNTSSGVLTPYVSTGAGASSLSVTELQTAKTRLFRYVQRVSFPKEVACLIIIIIINGIKYTPSQ